MSFGTLPIEGFYVKINLHSKKRLLSCSYDREKNNIKNHLQALSTSLDIYSLQFDHLIILGNFDVEIENSEMKEFCLNYNLKSLIHTPTFSKTLKQLYALISNWHIFQSYCVVETGLSDFHKMTVAVMKYLSKS